jgi:hypothetical protein
MTFRNRLSPATHQQIGEAVLQVAHALGFADPTWMDVDSTVQETNIAYPADAQLMRKLAYKGAKVLAVCKKAQLADVSPALQFDLAAINRKAKEYFFWPRTPCWRSAAKSFGTTIVSSHTSSSRCWPFS